MKKKVLFICSNMKIGGFQKSLISLLRGFDYKKYDVDLLLLDPQGVFMEMIPKEVNIITVKLPACFLDSLKTSIKGLLNKKMPKLLIFRAIIFLISLWDNGYAAYFMSRFIQPLEKKYDVAIDYCGQYILYYMVDKVRASRKISYFHNDYEKWDYYESMDKRYYSKVDAIVTVSDSCVKSLIKYFPEFSCKIHCVENINSINTVNIFPLDSNTFTDGFDGFKIVTIGRVCQDKGIDYAIEACGRLIEAGYKVKWYSVGPIETKKIKIQYNYLIKKWKIENDFVFLGGTNNPYDYMRKADIIVNPSRFEGKAVAIEEAKILCKPIVVTNFSTVSDQIENNKNGLIVDMDGAAIFEGVKNLLDNPDMMEKLVTYLKNNPADNESERQKVYELIEGNYVKKKI